MLPAIVHSLTIGLVKSIEDWYLSFPCCVDHKLKILDNLCRLNALLHCFMQLSIWMEEVVEGVDEDYGSLCSHCVK